MVSVVLMVKTEQRFAEASGIEMWSLPTENARYAIILNRYCNFIRQKSCPIPIHYTPHLIYSSKLYEYIYSYI